MSQIGARHGMKRKRGTDLAGMPLNVVSEGKGEKERKKKAESRRLLVLLFSALSDEGEGEEMKKPVLFILGCSACRRLLLRFMFFSPCLCVLSLVVMLTVNFCFSPLLCFVLCFSFSFL